MIDQVKNFLFEYFWLPIIDSSVHYNIYNTIVYAFVFAYVALYLVFPLVKRMDLAFDREFFIAVTPYIFLGGFLRALRDHQIIDTILLETPIIYILMFVFVVSTLFISKKLEGRELVEYHKLTSVIGLVLVLVTLSLFETVNFPIVFDFIILSLVSILPILAGLYFLKPEYLTYAFVIPVAAHFLDAASTIVALGQGAEEKHVLANIFIDIFGSYGMFIMKGLVIIPITFVVLKEFEGNERNYYLFLISLLGLALATRNMTAITLGS